MAINRRRAVQSILGATLLLPQVSLAQDEWNTTAPNIVDAWADASEHAILHEKLRLFLSAVIGRSKEERLEISMNYLSEVEPLDPTFVLAESAAYGVLVRGNPIRNALSAGYHRSSKEGLLFAISEYPDSPWTAMMNSAWHYEVIRRSTIGASVMGASGSKGEEFMDTALSDDPKDPGLYLAAAISLLSEKPKKRADRASALLEIGVRELDALNEAGGSAALPQEYVETVQTHTLRLRSILNEREPSDAKNYVLEIF